MAMSFAGFSNPFKFEATNVSGVFWNFYSFCLNKIDQVSKSNDKLLCNNSNIKNKTSN